jgi:hypothetical protein
MNSHLVDTLKPVGDAVSIVTVLGALAAVLPPIAALFTIVWTVIRIYETETMKRWLARWRRDAGV